MARPQVAEQDRPSIEELLALPAMVDLTTAGRAFGMGRGLSYESARSGEFPCPVQRFGRFWRVRKADLMHSLGLAMDGTPLPAPASGDPEAA